MNFYLEKFELRRIIELILLYIFWLLLLMIYECVKIKILSQYVIYLQLLYSWMEFIHTFGSFHCLQVKKRLCLVQNVFYCRKMRKRTQNLWIYSRHHWCVTVLWVIYIKRVPKFYSEWPLFNNGMKNLNRVKSNFMPNIKLWIFLIITIKWNNMRKD